MNKAVKVLTIMLALVLGYTPLAMSAAAEKVRLVVVLHDKEDSPTASAKEIASMAGGKVGFVYGHALKGFAITVPEQAVESIKKNPRVKYVEPDTSVQAFTQNVPSGVRRVAAPDNPKIGIDGSDRLRMDVDVAVIDTGVDFEHPDLNVAGGISCIGSGDTTTACSTGGDDDHYHGTHVAGTIGAIDNGSGVVGVAPGARIWAVKVLDRNGSGYLSWILAGIDWVAAHADTIEVANMSLGSYGYSQAEYEAIQRAVDKGVAFAVAAGNSGIDASKYSPAAFDNVMSVSALADFNGAAGGGAAPTCLGDQDDTLAYFSNRGSAVDIVAPGVCITSTLPIEWGGHYGTLCGTSMASPHVAGALALLASVNKPGNADQVQALYNEIASNGSASWTDDSGDGVKEPLLDLGNVNVFAPKMIAGVKSAPPPNSAPTVQITSPASGTTVTAGTTLTFTGTAADAEDGNLAAGITWISSLHGTIGYGGSISTVGLKTGTHTITALVGDSKGASASTSIVIIVNPQNIMSLVAKTTVSKKRKYGRLGWGMTPATFAAVFGKGKEIKNKKGKVIKRIPPVANVDVYRNGVKVKRVKTKASGSLTDGPVAPNLKTAVYKVCVAGSTSLCSNPAMARW